MPAVYQARAAPLTPLEHGLQHRARVGRLDPVPVEERLLAIWIGWARGDWPGAVQKRDSLLGGPRGDVLCPSLPGASVCHSSRESTGLRLRPVKIE